METRQWHTIVLARLHKYAMGWWSCGSIYLVKLHDSGLVNSYLGCITMVYQRMVWRSTPVSSHSSIVRIHLHTSHIPPFALSPIYAFRPLSFALLHSPLDAFRPMPSDLHPLPSYPLPFSVHRLVKHPVPCTLNLHFSPMSPHAIFSPIAPSLFALQIPPSSPSKLSNFHISAFSLHSSSASSPPRHAACRCGDDTAIKMDVSPIGTSPSLWMIDIAVSLCLVLTSLARLRSVVRARGTYDVYVRVLTGFSAKLSRVVPALSCE